jgi:hypothetical protein
LLAVFHDPIDAREQIDVPQDVAFHGDDVSKLSFADRAKVSIDVHLHRRPVGRSAQRGHCVNAEVIDPRLELVPGRVAVELNRNVAVGVDEQEDALFLQLLELVLQLGESGLRLPVEVYGWTPNGENQIFARHVVQFLEKLCRWIDAE